MILPYLVPILERALHLSAPVRMSFLNLEHMNSSTITAIVLLGGVLIFVIGFFSWPYIGRIVRAQTMTLRKREFIEAATSLGAIVYAITRTGRRQLTSETENWERIAGVMRVSMVRRNAHVR